MPTGPHATRTERRTHPCAVCGQYEFDEPEITCLACRLEGAGDEQETEEHTESGEENEAGHQK